MSDTSKQNNLTIKHVSKMTKGVREQDVRETTSHSWKDCYSTGSKKVWQLEFYSSPFGQAEASMYWP